MEEMNRQMLEEILNLKYDSRNLKALERFIQAVDYEKVKADLYISVVALKKQKDILKRGIYLQKEDIVLGVYLQLDEDEKNVSAIMVDKKYLEIWGVTKEEVLEQAMQNTMRMSPPRFYSTIEIALSTFSKESKGFEIEEYMPTNEERIMGCFFSTTRMMKGGTAIFYPETAKRICKAWCTPAIYIVPISVNEVAIHDSRYINRVENLRDALHYIMEIDPIEDEIISRRVFKYELEKDEIIAVL